jgi:5-formyltetrahydrofolate cyclo-ligase
MSDGAAMDQQAAKRELRGVLKATLAAVPLEVWSMWCADLHRRLVTVPEVAAARSVMAFVGLPAWREFDCEAVCRQVLGRGGRVALPRTEKSALTGATPMASWVQDWGRDVVADPASPFGGVMRGPRAGLEEARLAEVDLVIVPGLGFDERGGRLGRGAGFYDRVLGGLRPAARRVAVAFECQIVPQVPMGEHDERVDAVVTEARTIVCRGE